MTSALTSALQGLTVFERGWMSSNNVLLHGEPGEGATLVDSGHCVHASQTLALVRHALGDTAPKLAVSPLRGPQGDAAGLGAARRPAEPLARLVNTHLHSDHCGGNATLQREIGMPIHIPPGQWQAVKNWDEDALSYRATGQRCDRFTSDAMLAPDSTLRSGGRCWQVIAAPGHDPDAVMLFDADHGVLISADALWENGFGLVFPELEGVGAYDDVAAVLDLIERLPVACAIPGHGAPFVDVTGALGRARSRLAGFRADPARHERHAAKVLLKFHVLEEQSVAVADVRAWFRATPLIQGIWQRLGHPDGELAGWCDVLTAELVASGALSVREGVVHNV